MTPSNDPASERGPTVSVHSGGEEGTEALGRALGETLPGGTVVALSGGLGAGKTVFTRGVAAGLGVDPTEVASPTFVYLVDYDEGRVPLFHADLYRFAEVPVDRIPEVLESIGLEAALASDGITVVEWWPYYLGPEPTRLVRVEISVESGDTRSIRLEFRGPGLDAARAAVAAVPA